MFERDFMYWPNSQCMSCSISKCLIVNILIYHIFMLSVLKNPFMRWKLSNFSNGSQTWFKICGITCEIYITNFIKVKNHFNCFWNIFIFFNTQLNVLFSYKYISIHHDIHRKQLNYFLFYCLVMYYHNIQKHCEFFS
jgi:hypothetical protein